MTQFHRAVRVGFLGCFLLCAAFSTDALSGDRAVYDGPDVETPGTTIHGKVVRVGEHDSATHKWEVSVENVKTGEVVQLHLDRTTERREKDPDPSVGEMVIVKYDDTSKHALTFVKDVPNAPEP